MGLMTTPTRSAGDGGPAAALAIALAGALAAGTRAAFTALLTEDVHWGREHGPRMHLPR